MRTAPLGFLGHGFSETDVYAHGVAAAALTHGHPDGWAPAGVLAPAVGRLLDGASWVDVVEAGLSAMQVHPAATGTRQLLTEVDAALNSSKPARASASFGLGWVGDEALAVGLHAAATAQSFNEAIEVASNHDGDSDSTASIAGQLYGAKHELSALPVSAIDRSGRSRRLTFGQKRSFWQRGRISRQAPPLVQRRVLREHVQANKVHRDRGPCNGHGPDLHRRRAIEPTCTSFKMKSGLATDAPLSDSRQDWARALSVQAG